MDPEEMEFTSLVGWLKTFSLQSEASTPAELSDGLALSEALFQIEPEVFTPSWFAGILQSDKSNNDTLNVILNLLLHYYRHNLRDICISGDLPVPDIPPGCHELSKEMISRLLKLMLGVAVTCNNKRMFIQKIQSLDETTQHALTACVASFINTKEWAGRVSAQSLNSELMMSSPPGDEIWAQKCHELDFQVALLKEERINLISENEELYGKVKTAQTLSRKDSVKARQFEIELEHMKDEFERLRLAYESTKEDIIAMETRLKPDGGEEPPEVRKLYEETSQLRLELAGLKSVLRIKEGGETKCGGLVGEGEVLGRLREQGEDLEQLRAMVEYQAGLAREVECLKDQMDVLREQGHSQTKQEQEFQDLKVRLHDFLGGGDMVDLGLKLRCAGVGGEMMPNRTLMSLESETCLSSSMEVGPSPQNGRLCHSMANNLLEETMVKPCQVFQRVECLAVQRDEMEEDHVMLQTNLVGLTSFKEEHRLVQSTSLDLKTTESTPFASRPESELDIGLMEEDVQATPRQLEMLLEESHSQASSSSSQSSSPPLETKAVNQLLRDIRDPLGASMEDMGIIQTSEHLQHSRHSLISQELSQASTIINKIPEQLFDPDDPKVKELEDWNCSLDRSVVEEEPPKQRLKNVFRLNRLSRSEEKNNLLLREKFGVDDEKEEDSMSVDCFNSWLLQMFVKVFD